MAALPVFDGGEDCTHMAPGRPCFADGNKDGDALHDDNSWCKPIDLTINESVRDKSVQ